MNMNRMRDQGRGNIFKHGCRDQDLLKRTDRGRQPGPPTQIEFGEYIVENQDRVTTG